MGRFNGGSQSSTAEPETKYSQLLASLLSLRSLTTAFTSIAMGFLTLLLLSRQDIPTGAIRDTLAFGIGLGFLSDDQLLLRQIFAATSGPDIR